MDPEAIAAAQRLQTLLPPGVIGTPQAPPPAPDPTATPAQVPQFQPPPMPQAPQMPAPAPGGPQFAPPGGAPAAPGAPGAPPEAAPGGMPEAGNEMVPVDPAQLAIQQQIESDAEAQREKDSASDTFGNGPRPRRGATMENPLDTASKQVAGELRGRAARLAGDLFPTGPAGTVQPSQAALAAYLRRHWDDPQFRMAMLDRMAPKGPDGKRVPWGVRAYIDLYKKSMEPGSGGPLNLPATPETPLPNPKGDDNPLPQMAEFERTARRPRVEDTGLPTLPGLNAQ